VTKIIYVLCTETSSYVNGAEIHINGGQHVQRPIAANHTPSSLRGALLSAEARLRAKADATKQSTLASAAMDCFAEPVIGRAFARPVGSQ
jgi:hypothetical protein